MSTRPKAPGPWRLTLVTNPDDCNLECGMCECGVARARGRRTAPRRMDPALALAILDERRASDLREVIPSTMGEPLLWAGIDAVLDRCLALGLRVNLTTNGTFPGRGAAAWAERLVPVASDVKISWNGATARTAEAVMRGLSFAAAVDGVRALTAARDAAAARGRRRYTVSFQVTAQQANADELADIVRLAGSLGVDRVKLNHLQPRLPGLAALALRGSSGGIARWNAAVREARAAAAEAGVLLENAVELDAEPARAARGPCRFVGQEAWVHPDGTFAPCPHPAAARGELGAFGSVAERSLGAIWTSDPFRAFVEGYEQHPICRTCPFRTAGGAG